MRSSRTQKGFTLIELMVTVGIFVFMTALLLARYNNFNSGTLLTNLAYDVALTLRQAQTYGLSVVNNRMSGENYQAAYGVFFDASSADKNREFIFFADTKTSATNSAGILDNDDVIVGNYKLKRGTAITGLCAVSGNSCSSSDFNKSKLSVTFKRPDPDAIIMAGSDRDSWYPYNYAEIRISQNGVHRIIKVNSYGQIGVQD